VQLSGKDKFDSVRVKMVDQKPTLQSTDILVYLVPSHPSGLLGTRFGREEKADNQYGRAAWNAAETEFGAEVYVRHLTDQPWDIAKFVWHEVLHVKTKEENEMHKRGGLAGDIEFGYQGSWLTDQNIKDMAAYMGKKRPMWTGGFDLKIKTGPITLD